MDDARVATTIAPPAPPPDPAPTVTGPVDPAIAPGQGAGRRIAYLSFSSGEYDARTFRMARYSMDEV
jgi:hypothetical protein